MRMKIAEYIFVFLYKIDRSAMELLEYSQTKLKEIQPAIFSNRIYDEEKIKKTENRNPFQRDYCRILYSNSFRRLQGKMQLLGYGYTKFFRNRLTHSLEVAQIAATIAERCGYKQDELYVVQAGAIAHDIGNPPFGHYGEKILNEIMKYDGGFEGNAQTLRVLMNLEQKNNNFDGMNLTYRTLLSVLKYFNKYGEKSKFIYDDNYAVLSKFIIKNKINLRTLDVQIVDLADEIAYACHDLEDGLNNNLFTLDDIIIELNNIDKKKGMNLKNEFKNFVNQAKKNIGCDNNKGSKQTLALLYKEILSVMINYFILDIGIINIEDEKYLKIGKECNKNEIGLNKYSSMVKILKDVVFKCIQYRNDVFVYEKRGEYIIRTIFDFCLNNSEYMPIEYRCDKDDKKLFKRKICDYISGMMDYFAIDTYEKITGDTFEKIDISKVEK